MEIQELSLPGVLLITPVVHQDERGFFVETFHAQRYRESGLPLDFVQDNHSKSAKGTLRGMHAQTRKPQGKLVRCIEGEIFDVAVDIRPASPTFGKWAGAIISAENFKQIYVPPGFAHGFCVISDIAQVEYKCTDVYDPGGELGILWNDPAIGIQWPFSEPTLSDKDSKALTLEQARAEGLLPAYEA